MPIVLTTIADDHMREVLARMIAVPVIPDTTNIRRDHRTTISRDKAPAVHLIDGDDTPKAATNDCYRDRSFAFRISIFVRDDLGYKAAEPIKCRIMAAIDPTTAYQHNIDLILGRITTDQQIADGDALRVDMEFVARYRTAGAWAL
jgi:hypothetical protein